MQSYLQFVSKKIIHFCGQYYEEILNFKITKFTVLEGYFIGYQKNFKWFYSMVKFKSNAYFYEGRWKQLGLILHPLRLTTFCL